MKIVELGTTPPSLEKMIGLAKQELVVLRKPDGSVFALSPVDEFAVEMEMLKNNPEFMAYLKQRSEERVAISLEELRGELAV